MTSRETTPLCMWSEHAESAARCERCSAAFCEHCAGRAPNEKWCAACDRRFGAVPWERRPSGFGAAIKAWAITLDRLWRAPNATAHRIGNEGSLASPAYFAMLALALHVVLGPVSRIALIWLQTSVVMERFGAADSVSMLVAHQAADVVFADTLAMPVVACVAPFALLVATRLAGGTVELRAVARVVAYACGYLVLGVVPVVGLVALPLLIYFLASWVEASTTLPRLRRLVALTIHVGLCLLAMEAGLALYDATLRGPALETMLRLMELAGLA